jgi:hypothetical protein
VPLLMLATPFILRTWRTFTPFVLTLTVETLIAGVFFLVLPLAQAYPPRVADGFFGGVFHLADRLNLDYNKFPSLNIAFAVTAAVVFGRRCGWLGRTVFAIWMAAVLASTMLIHEHQILDLLGGLSLGLFGAGAVQRRVTDERYLDALRIDALCLGPLVASVRCHVRSLSAFWAITRVSLPRWGQTRPLRVAFCLAQHVDDALAGKRPVGVAPEAYVGLVLAVLRDGAPAGDAVGEQMAAYLAAELSVGEKNELGELLESLIEEQRRLEARHPAAAQLLAARVRRIFPPPLPASSAGTAPAPPRSAASR